MKCGLVTGSLANADGRAKMRLSCWFGTLVVLALLSLLVMPGCARKQGATAQQPARVPADTAEYLAHGTEPFWSVSVTREGIVFSEPNRPEGLHGSYVPATREGANLVFRSELRGPGATPLELTLREEPCNDSMSDREYPYTAIVRVGDRVLRGCGEHRATAVKSPDSVALELGDWTVVSHRLPGVGAMTDAEAAKWHGRVAHYASHLAVFGPDSCRGPSYRSRVVRGDSLLGVAYHVAPSAFGLAPGETITLIEIRCFDSPWIAPGGTLLRMPDGTTYTVWDGTFFELGRR